MTTIALVTDQDSLPFDYDMPLIEEAFRVRGIDVQLQDWDNTAVDWAAFACVVVRSPWSYTRRPNAFREWCETTASATRLINPKEVLVWSLDKSYLAELRQSGVPVVPTTFCDPGSDDLLSLDLLFDEHSEVVIKPSVGANSRQVRRFAAAQVDEATAHIRLIHSFAKSAMIQPYLRAIDEVGETNLIFFGGQFSHAIRKAPLLGCDGKTSKPTMDARTLRRPGPDELAVAEAALKVAAAQAGGRPLAYGRVDLIRDDRGNPVVLELEVCEPSFSMPLVPESAARLVDAVMAALQS